MATVACSGVLNPPMPDLAMMVAMRSRLSICSLLMMLSAFIPRFPLWPHRGLLMGLWPFCCVWGGKCGVVG